MRGLADDVVAAYGLRPSQITAHPGGFEAECFVADGRWFIKVWREGSAPERLATLLELRDRGLPVPAPLVTRNGDLLSTWNGRPYAVFPFVRGRTAVADDWAEVARALRRTHAVVDVSLPQTTMAEPEIAALQHQLDHPWIRERKGIVTRHITRLHEIIALARSIEVAHVLCHRDFGGDNLLLDQGRIVAILDWEQAVVGPREHDLWIAAEEPRGEALLREYDAYDLDRTHLEYALLARALRDMAARVLSDRDREGVDTWGFDRLDRLPHDLELFRPFCR